MLHQKKKREREREISKSKMPPKLASLKDAKTGTFAPKIPSRRKLTQNVFEEEKVKKERKEKKKENKVELVASGRKKRVFMFDLWPMREEEIQNGGFLIF